jgi:hypothetical protein
MSFHIAGQQTLVEECIDPMVLSDRIPVMEEFFNHVAEVRNIYEEQRSIINGRHRAGLSADETILHIARFPCSTWSAILAEEPCIMKDKKAFFRKLNMYPAYRTGHIKLLG